MESKVVEKANLNEPFLCRRNTARTVSSAQVGKERRICMVGKGPVKAAATERIQSTKRAVDRIAILTLEPARRLDPILNGPLVVRCNPHREETGPHDRLDYEANPSDSTTFCHAACRDRDRKLETRNELTCPPSFTPSLLPSPSRGKLACARIFTRRPSVADRRSPTGRLHPSRDLQAPHAPLAFLSASIPPPCLSPGIGRSKSGNLVARRGQGSLQICPPWRAAARVSQAFTSQIFTLKHPSVPNRRTEDRT